MQVTYVDMKLGTSMELNSGVNDCIPCVGSLSARKRFFFMNKESISVHFSPGSDGLRSENVIESNKKLMQGTMKVDMASISKRANTAENYTDGETCKFLSDYHILPVPSTCKHCSTLKFHKETKTFCFSDGHTG